MSFTKSDIAKNIAIKTSVSNQTAKQLLDKFIQVVVSVTNKRQVKISGFGTFAIKKTPRRIGRNPKTGEEFEILESSKLKTHLILPNIEAATYQNVLRHKLKKKDYSIVNNSDELLNKINKLNKDFVKR